MKTMRKPTRVVIPGLAALVILLMLGVRPAAADSISFDLTQGNTGGLDCCTGPYANVTITLTSATTATVTFTSLTNGGYIYLMAGNGAIGVNVNATSFTVGGISSTNFLSGFTPGPVTPDCSPPTPCNSSADYETLNEDGFGSFNLQLDSFDGFTHSSTTITFTLTNTGGTWASAADVLADNGEGNDAAIHGFACVTSAQNPCDSSTGAFATGYASVDGPPVPEPASIALFGSGLMALAEVIRRRKKTAK